MHARSFPRTSRTRPASRRPAAPFLTDVPRGSDVPETVATTRSTARRITGESTRAARRPVALAASSTARILFVTLPLALALGLGACAKPVTTQHGSSDPSLAEQLAGENRTVTQEARGLIVSLPGILFDFDQATLRDETMSTLQQVADVLLRYPTLEIHVEGHTDDVGSDEYNLDLSERRARAVYDFLVGEGIYPEQIQSAGFGESKPVAPNDTPEGRQQNRRVDLVIPDPPQ